MTTAQKVADWLRDPTAASDPVMADVCQAVDQWAAAAVPYVARLLAVNPDVEALPADVREGLVMLAARDYRRRGRPDGVIDGADVGPVYLPGRDRDVDPKLRIGTYRIPMAR